MSCAGDHYALLFGNRRLGGEIFSGFSDRRRLTGSGRRLLYRFYHRTVGATDFDDSVSWRSGIYHLSGCGKRHRIFLQSVDAGFVFTCDRDCCFYIDNQLYR